VTSSAGDGVAPAGSGRGRLLGVLLAVSLALNLCFVGGAAWIRVHRPVPPAARIAQISKELNLTPAQHAAFQNYFRTMRRRFQLMRTEIDPVIADAWGEIAKPQPDEAKITHDFELAGAKRRAFAEDATKNTLAFLATLSPDQRRDFVTMLRHHHGLWVKHH
jgi:Spy/CpxP family protein refolding chaperone